MKTYLNRHVLKIMAAVVLMTTSPVYCMNFHTFYIPEWKRTVIDGEGEIVSGDAASFSEISKQGSRDQFGNVTLVLNSPGGSVDAAMEMVKVMDAVGVTTIVPPGGYCASACASILFVSGSKRAVFGTGLLGFHTCYNRTQSGDEKNDLCNDAIASNAVAHGVCYGVVDVWTKSYSAGQVAWLGPETACQMGLCSVELVPESKSCASFVDGLVDGFLKKP